MAETSTTDGDITVNVTFSGKKYPISISPNATVTDLKALLLPLTNVLTRGQKLIFKGKVLEDSQTLSASELKNGSKIMLMASQGLHQGDGPILKRVGAIPRNRRDHYPVTTRDIKTLPMKERLGLWTVTGVIPLSECNLKAIPDEVWTCGSSGRFLDCSDNSIENVPIEIESLTGLEKLYLNSNKLSEESISWEGLTTLKHLTVLSLTRNCLTTLPPAVGSLISLKFLYVSHNHLKNLPNEIGQLTKLEVLRADNNRISTISECIGNCDSLVEVEFSSNNLSALPETFSNLTSLKSLHLRNNAMKSLPSKLFKDCPHLDILDLHNTEITIDILRKFDGWDNFDERRRSKHQKQLDFRVGVSRDFDEGADKK